MNEISKQDFRLKVVVAVVFFTTDTTTGYS